METIKECYKNNKKIIDILLQIIYIVIFVCLAIFVGSKHEHWADEAQSWLIARDLNFIDIIKTIRYEGTPPLWHLILRVFILCGGKYENLIYLTTFFSVLGIVFLFRNKNIPILVKVLLPFTFFVFFQYTIVARSYGLIFPILMYILLIYPNKEKHLVKYAIALILLMNISSHTFLIAAGLWLDFLIQEISLLKNGEKIPINRKIFLIVMALIFLIVVIMVFPPKDGAYKPGSMLDSCRILSESMFTSVDNKIVYYIGMVLFFVSIVGGFTSKENIIKFSILLYPNLLWISVVNGSGWHIGILFLIIIFAYALTNSFKKLKFAYILIIISMLIQVYWNIICSINDINNKFSVGNDVKNYLIEIGYEDKEIAGVDFWAIQVNPCFDKNIYSNFNNSFINWKKDLFEKCNSEYILNSEKEYDIYIIPAHDFKYNKSVEYYKDSDIYYEVCLMQKLYGSGKYAYKYFDGNIYYKDKIYESTGLYVFVKNE